MSISVFERIFAFLYFWYYIFLIRLSIKKVYKLNHAAEHKSFSSSASEKLNINNIPHALSEANVSNDKQEAMSEEVGINETKCIQYISSALEDSEIGEITNTMDGISDFAPNTISPTTNHKQALDNDFSGNHPLFTIE